MIDDRHFSLVNQINAYGYNFVNSKSKVTPTNYDLPDIIGNKFQIWAYFEEKMNVDIASNSFQPCISFAPLHFLWNLFHDALYRGGRNSI